MTLPLPGGFLAHTGRAGLRDDGDDFAVIVGTRPCTSAGVFTQSRFAGPSVTLSRPRVAAGHARAVVVVAKNANVATGEQGRLHATELTTLVGEATGVAPEEVLIASTGVIGRPYPMDLLRVHVASLAAPGGVVDVPVGRQGPGSEHGRAGSVDGAADSREARAGIGPDVLAAGAGSSVIGWDADAWAVARSIMTTDTVPKTAERRIAGGGGGDRCVGDGAGPRVVGIAKGVGMIEPNMATMLVFALTDAEVDAGTLDRLWRRAIDDTFNCLSVDTDTSTSDTAVVLASGAAGPVGEAALAVALREVCLDLTLQLARDGEGATRLITVTVVGARDREQARRVAKAIVNSPLVKTAVHGADPNWGRVAMAVGKCSDDTDIDPDRVVIRFGDIEAYPAIPGPAGLDQLRTVMSADHVDIEVELGIGGGEATVYGCDLSAEYVRINADYTT